MREKINVLIDVFKYSAIYLLMVIGNVLLFTTILFFLNITITPYHLPITCIITAIIFGFLYRKGNIRKILISILIAIIVLGCGMFIEGKIYDVTSDGNTYHKLAIGCMKNGWNPAYEDSRDFTNTGKNDFVALDENVNPLWIDHYPKATEIFAANIYAFTNNIESGKVYILLLMYIVFGITTSYLYKDKKMNILFSLVISLLLVVNPITIVQINNYYVDGALGLSLFLLVLTCFTMPIKDEYYARWEKLLILAISIVLCINIKFTGLGFAGMFCFAFYLYWLYVSYKNETLKQDFKLYTLFYIGVVLVSILVVGFSSYTRNMIDHGHPCYPLYGKNAVENIGLKEQPKSFTNKNRIEIFLISIFSKGENVLPSYDIDENQPTLKIPFTFTYSELKNYDIPDIRIGGYGPLFSGIFCISILVTIIMLIAEIRNKNIKSQIPYLIFLIVSFILLNVLDGVYWARYIPYIYCLPIYVLYYLLKDSKKRVNVIVGVILAIILAINSSMLIYITCKSTLESTHYVNRKLDEFKTATSEETVQMKLSSPGIQGIIYNLTDKGITNYEVVDEVEGENDGYFFTY